MLSVPVMTWLGTAENRPDYLEWVEKIKADRIFIGMGMPYDHKELNDITLASLAENLAYFRNPTTRDGEARPGYEVGIWINGLGHGVGMDPNYAYLTERYTKLRDLETGKEIGDSLCPLDENYVKMYSDFIKRIASLRPDLIMIDDDFRLSCHGPVAIGCACERHMALFNERARAAGVVDHDMTREELAAVLFTGEATPHRRVWLDLMHDTLCDHARKLRRAVDEIDPAIRLGHCVSLPTWDLDGVDAIELARCFAGQNRPFVRFAGAPYWDENQGFIAGLERMQAAWCRAHAPDIEIMSEGDTYPRPRFNVPASHLEVFDQMLLCDGFSDILKYMLDYIYEPGYETGYVRLHLSEAPLRAAMTEAFADTEGAGVYICEPIHKLADMDCTGYEGYDLSESFKPASVRYMAALGLPASFERTRYTPTAVVFGESAKYADAATLSDNLILDAAAARILLARGVDVGLGGMEPMDKPATETTGTPVRTYPVDIESRFYRLDPKADAEVLGVYDNGAPALIAYTRADGKMVLVYAFEMARVDFSAVYMKNYSRRAQIFDRPELGIPVTPTEPGLCVICRRNEHKMAVGMWNVGEDIALAQENIRLDRAYAAVRPIGEGSVTLQDDAVAFNTEIPPFCFGGFVVEE